MTLPTLLLLYPLLFLLFWTPGLTGGWVLGRRLDLAPAFTLPLGLVVAGLVGQAFFWVYFFSPQAGSIASAVWVIATLGWLAATVPWRGHPLRAALASLDVSRPLALSAVIGLLYLSLLFLYPVNWEPQEAVFGRAPTLYLAIDNEIPMWFADRLEKGEDPRAIVGDWRSSDRPPLQTGITLALRALVGISGVSAGTHYQLLGTVVQCGWVGVFWMLTRLMMLEPRRQAWTLALVACTAFFYWHSIYVWPKMLAGSFTLTALVLVLPTSDQGGRPTWTRVALAGVAAGLGLLAHGGAFFTLLGIALYLLRPSLFPGVARTALGAAMVALTLLPWTLYQKLYDPPGDRLVKWHLAGVIQPDERSAGQALADCYRSTSVRDHLNARGDNLATLVGRPLIEYPHDFSVYQAQQASQRRRAGDRDGAAADRPWLPWAVRLRLAVVPGDPEEAHTQIDLAHRHWINGQYYHLIRALGLLNLGWLALLLGKRGEPGTSLTRHLWYVAWGSLAVWLALMVLPVSTVIHHGSYATFMLFFLGLAVALARLPNWCCAAVLALLVLELLAVWVTHTADADRPDAGMALAAAAAALALAALLRVTARAAPPSGEEPPSPVLAPPTAIP